MTLNRRMRLLTPFIEGLETRETVSGLTTEVTMVGSLPLQGNSNHTAAQAANYRRLGRNSFPIKVDYESGRSGDSSRNSNGFSSNTFTTLRSVGSSDTPQSLLTRVHLASPESTSLNGLFERLDPASKITITPLNPPQPNSGGSPQPAEGGGGVGSNGPASATAANSRSNQLASAAQNTAANSTQQLGMGIAPLPSDQHQSSSGSASIHPVTAEVDPPGEGPNDFSIGLEVERLTTSDFFPGGGFGNYLNSTGDVVEIRADARKPFASVTYMIDGGIDINTYQFSYDRGVTNRITAPVVKNIPNVPTPSSSDTEIFWLDETQRIHTISATCTYQDGTAGSSNILSVDVRKANRDSLKDVYASTNLATGNLPVAGQQEPAIIMINSAGGGVEGETFTAQVDMPSHPSGQNWEGEFGFLQLVKANRTFTVTDGTNQQVLTQSSGGEYVLDALPNPNDSPMYPGSISGPYQPNATDISLGPVTDSPLQGAPISDYQKGLYTKKVVVNDNFKMYLMYHSIQPGGPAIWVAIGMVEWSWGGTLDYNGPATGNPAAYANPDNWSLTGEFPIATPNGPNTIQGTDPDTPFPTWTTNVKSLPIT